MADTDATRDPDYADPTLTVELDLREATWGHLRAFLRLADLSGITDDSPVAPALNHHDEMYGIRVPVDPLALTHGGGR